MCYIKELSSILIVGSEKLTTSEQEMNIYFYPLLKRRCSELVPAVSLGVVQIRDKKSGDREITH